MKKTQKECFKSTESNKKEEPLVNAGDVLTEKETTFLENTLQKFAKGSEMTFDAGDVVFLKGIQNKLKKELKKQTMRLKKTK